MQYLGQVRFLALLSLAGLLMVATGCKQRRYEPAQWRPAVGTPTLPQAQVAQGTSLPGRGSSLPGRGTTLAGRGGSTLPGRGGSTLPGRGSTLPGRQTTLPGRSGLSGGQRPIWDTSPKKDFVRPQSPVDPQWRQPLSGSTLPGRRTGTTLPGRIPDHLQPRRNGTTLPGRAGFRSGTTLPGR